MTSSGVSITTVCENCGHEVPNDLKHISDPYEKGVCQTIDVDTSKCRGRTRHKDTVKNVEKESDAPAK